VARHPDRWPHCRDYIEALFTEYTPLAGDRNFADDHAVMGGLARFDDRPVVVIGHEKGHDTKTRIERNFGMARPEGYRKAIRLMDLAHRFGLPVITLVDTPAPIPARAPRNAASPKRSRARPRNAWRSACRSCRW
jgi:acetyl-CoA carboxylase carboxyl transferase subunit alpha